jgi:hypothetical protein
VGPGATVSPPITEVLGEFNGPFISHCSGLGCETDTIGNVFVPADATSAVFSGTFGNSQWPNSAAMAVTFGTAIKGVPGPVMGAVFQALCSVALFSLHGGAASDTLKWSAEFMKMKSPGLRRPGLLGRKAGGVGQCLQSTTLLMSSENLLLRAPNNLQVDGA